MSLQEMNPFLRDLLDRHAFLVLSTINPDGAPHADVIRVVCRLSATKVIEH